MGWLWLAGAWGSPAEQGDNRLQGGFCPRQQCLLEHKPGAWQGAFHTRVPDVPVGTCQGPAADPASERQAWPAGPQREGKSRVALVWEVVGKERWRPGWSWFRAWLYPLYSFKALVKSLPLMNVVSPAIKMRVTGMIIPP